MPLVASTMLLTTLSLFHVIGGLLARDQRQHDLRSRHVPGPTQLRRYGLALVLTSPITGIDFLQRLLGTTSLDLNQWCICIGLASSLLVMEELMKFVIRRRTRRSHRRRETPTRTAAPVTT